MEEENSNKSEEGGALKTIEGIIAAALYGHRSYSDAMYDQTNFKKYESLVAVFVAGMQANLSQRMASDKPGRLNGKVLDAIAHAHIPPDIVEDMKKVYSAQYDYLKSVDKQLLAAMEIEGKAFSKTNIIANSKWLKAQVLKTGSGVAKTTVDYVDKTKAGLMGLNAGIVKLIYNAGFAAGNYVDIDLKDEENIKAMAELRDMFAFVPIGLYIYSQLHKFTFFAYNITIIGATAALDAVFAHLNDAEHDKLTGGLIPNQVSFEVRLSECVKILDQLSSKHYTKEQIYNALKEYGVNIDKYRIEEEPFTVPALNDVIPALTDAIMAKNNNSKESSSIDSFLEEITKNLAAELEWGTPPRSMSDEINPQAIFNNKWKVIMDAQALGLSVVADLTVAHKASLLIWIEVVKF